jgi:hypothetical protein
MLFFPQKRASEFLSLVDEHDRYVVLDGVLQATAVADELGVILVVLQVSLALRTSQYLKQSGIQHGLSPCSAGIAF